MEASDPNVPVVINEILAANGTAIRDLEGEYDDWIELYNAGDKPVDIGGMYLTDDLADPTKWRIPSDNPAATTIAAHGYFLIWADGDTADRGLHASFKLNDDGEDIGLFAADGITLIDGFSFGKQRVDISYGRYPDGDPNLQFLPSITPGGSNVTTYAGLVEEPQIEPASRLCTEPIVVTLTTSTEGATIYYTFDGTEPFSGPRGRPLGSTYTGPIPVARTVTLKAAAWRSGWKQSPTRTERYVFTAADVRAFSSPLPIAVVDTMGKSIGRPQVPAYGYFFNTNEEGTAMVSEEIDFGGKAAINIRGKSSEGFPKHQYHFETWDERNKDKSVSILGFPAESDWVLQGPYSDKALMRNVLAYGWSNDIGRYAPRTRFIELFLNTDNSSVTMDDYLGVYAFMEKIKIGADRVDLGEPPAGAAGSGITGGYIIKKDKLDPDDRTFNTSRGQTLVYADPNGFELSQQELDWIRNFMSAFEAALYGANFADPVNGYAKFIDVGSFIDHHIIVELCKNIDGFRLSTYMHIDHSGVLHMGPVWDYDLSLGNANYLEGWIATGWYNRQLGDGDYPYWRRLFQDPEFRLRYADRWFELRRNQFTTDRLLQRIEDYAVLLDQPQARNFQRWVILGIYVWPNWFIAKTFREEVDWMKGWLTGRVMWMDGQIATEFAPAPPSFSSQGGHVTPGFELTMTAPAGTMIYYTLGDADPRTFSELPGPTKSVRLIAENAPKWVLVPTGPVADAWRGGEPFDDSAWVAVAGNPGGIGYEKSVGYGSYITYDTGSQMFGLQSSCYVRIPFSFADNVDDVGAVTLRVRYDDGFVAYLNGVEIARRNFTGTPLWNSSATVINDDASAVNLEIIPITNFKQALRNGDNILAIHAMNQPATSSDFLISLELAADEYVQQQGISQVQRYTAPVPITQTVRVRARIMNGGKWGALNEAVFAVGPVAESLRISEIMYHPADTGNPDDPNTEFIELTNIGSAKINLNLVRFTNGVNFTFPSFDLAPGAYCLVVKDTAAFTAKHGSGLPVLGQYSGSLSNAGERIELLDAAGAVIQNFRFEDNWFDITDGLGFSLTARSPKTTDPNSYGSKDAWRPSAKAGGSPGTDDSGQVPVLGSIVINELLANSQGSGPDWIELYNTSTQAINIGGWFLSDDANDLTKYKIAAGTSIAAGGYKVFYEDKHFGNSADPGCKKPFALSRTGETVYLHSGSAGVLTGYSEQEKFDASEAGVTLGRYQRSTGTYNFVALSKATPGAANASPQVGPVVINEIMYHPDAPADAEYVELLNISSEPATLYDADRELPWRFTDDPEDPGIELLFPTDPPVTLAAGEYLLLVKDVAMFSSKYTAPAGVKVLAWGLGNLADGGEKIELSKPDDPDGQGNPTWIRVDRVAYSNGSHPQDFAEGVDPWPVQADGHGSSLSRTTRGEYGNDPANWHAATPSPGQLAAHPSRNPGR